MQGREDSAVQSTAEDMPGAKSSTLLSVTLNWVSVVLGFLGIDTPSCHLISIWKRKQIYSVKLCLWNITTQLQATTNDSPCHLFPNLRCWHAYTVGPRKSGTFGRREIRPDLPGFPICEVAWNFGCPFQKRNESPSATSRQFHWKGSPEMGCLLESWKGLFSFESVLKRTI